MPIAKHLDNSILTKSVNFLNSLSSKTHIVKREEEFFFKKSNCIDQSFNTAMLTPAATIREI